MSMHSSVRGRSWVIVGLVVVYALIELYRGWAFASYNADLYPMPGIGIWVVNAAVFFTGVFLWSSVAHGIAKQITAEPPAWSKFVELYLLTSLVITMLVIYRVTALQLNGHLLFSRPFEWVLMTKGLHLLMFGIPTTAIIRAHARKPAPLVSTRGGGLA